jgi:cyclase
MLRAGADKISINTAAVLNPQLITDGAQRYGSQCIVLSIDVRRVSPAGEPAKWEVFTHTGANARSTGIDAVEWAIRGAALGAGELVINSMDADGTYGGYDIELLHAISSRVTIPVIASGGAGTLEHLYEGFMSGGADAVLAASIFHFGDYTITAAKTYLRSRNVPMR